MFIFRGERNCCAQSHVSGPKPGERTQTIVHTSSGVAVETTPTETKTLPRPRLYILKIFNKIEKNTSIYLFSARNIIFLIHSIEKNKGAVVCIL